MRNGRRVISYKLVDVAGERGRTAMSPRPVSAELGYGIDNCLDFHSVLLSVGPSVASH